MEDITVDHADGSYIVVLIYAGKKYRIQVQIDVHKGGFRGGDPVFASNGRPVTDDLKYSLPRMAEREVAAWLREQNQRSEHYFAFTMYERVQISIIITILEYRNKNHAHPKLSRKIIERVHKFANSVAMASDAVGDLFETTTVKRSLPESVKFWTKEVPEPYRSFYRSVLFRAFAWKSGKIPYETYERYLTHQAIFTGIELAE